MKLIRAATIDDAALASSNVIETPPAAYNSGTSYALGGTASVFSGPSNTLATVYESLQPANINHTPASSPTWWRAIGTAYLPYNGVTSYAELAVVTDAAGHRLYRSLAAANSGNPLSDATKWQDIGPTNRWAMLDDRTGTQTVRPLEIRQEFNLTGRIDTALVFNVSALAVSLQMFDGATEIYNQSFSMVSTRGINDWWKYLFEPIVYRRDLAIPDLPNVGNPKLILSATTSAGNVAIGHFVAGLAAYIGETESGAKVGIRDRSRVDEDEFGVTFINRRPTSKKGSFEVWIDDEDCDFVFNLLESYAGQPVAMIAEGRYDSTQQFGLLKDWGQILTGLPKTTVTIDFEAI